MGAHWEYRKKPKKSLPCPSKKKKTGALLSGCWAFFSLAAQNFYFQNCLSPFLAWANGRIENNQCCPVLGFLRKLHFWLWLVFWLDVRHSHGEPFGDSLGSCKFMNTLYSRLNVSFMVVDVVTFWHSMWGLLLLNFQLTLPIIVSSYTSPTISFE